MEAEFIDGKGAPIRESDFLRAVGAARVEDMNVGAPRERVQAER